MADSSQDGSMLFTLQPVLWILQLLALILVAALLTTLVQWIVGRGSLRDLWGRYEIGYGGMAADMAFMILCWVGYQLLLGKISWVALASAETLWAPASGLAIIALVGAVVYWRFFEPKPPPDADSELCDASWDACLELVWPLRR